MTKEIILGPMGQGVTRLIQAFETHARVALRDHEMTQEIRNEVESVTNDLEPTLRTLVVTINKTDSPEVGFQALWRLITCAVTLINKNENKEDIPPDVQKKLLKETSVKGGINSGISRAAQAEQGWMAHALELAKQNRLEDSSISQDELASEIIAGWKDKDNACVGHARLKQVISMWEKAGKLVPRKPILKKALRGKIR